MEHVAIDLAGRESQICVRGADGSILEECRRLTRTLGEYLAKRPWSRVVVETCAEAFAVADQALELGHQVRVVPATLVRSLGVGSRRTKNDAKDARVMSEVSCRIDLPSVHVPSAISRRRKSICGMREALVTARTSLVNTVRGWLRGAAKGPLRSGAVETFVNRVRDRMGENERPRYVERQLETIEMLNRQIVEADDELAVLSHKDEECRRLMTVPGVGPVTAIRFVAAVDEIGRFANAHQLESYLGLVPGESSSGDKVHRTSITKAGSPRLRTTLIQAAWSARRSGGVHPMVLWALEVEKRRGRRIATVALARKMAGIMYALLRDGSRYNAPRGATI